MSIFLISTLLSLPPVLFWGYFFYKKDVKEPEPLRLMALAFLYGFMGGVAVMAIQFFGTQSGQFNLLRFLGEKIGNIYTLGLIILIILAILEEVAKHFSVVRMLEIAGREFDHVVDAIEYSIAAALGFAFVENSYYFLINYHLIGQGSAFFGLFIFRSLGTMLAHTVFSGIFGYFYGLSRQSGSICKYHTIPVHHFHKHLFKALKFRIIRHHIHSKKSSDHEHEAGVLTTEGLLIASFLHILFNVFNTVTIGNFPLAYLNVPLLLGGLAYLSFLFKKSQGLAINNDQEPIFK